MEESNLVKDYLSILTEEERNSLRGPRGTSHGDPAGDIDGMSLSNKVQRLLKEQQKTNRLLETLIGKEQPKSFEKIDIDEQLRNVKPPIKGHNDPFGISHNRSKI